jgi:hypothetical protein
MNNLAIRCLVSIAVLLTLGLLVACDLNIGGKATPTPGPNAHLSNAELLKQAATNMSHLQSYHLKVVNEMEGGLTEVESASGIFSQAFELTADVQPPNKGSRFYWRSTDAERHGLEVAGRFYDSAENDVVWYVADSLSSVGLWVDFFVRLWGNKPHFISVVQDITSGLLSVDNSDPVYEESDGVRTRRMTANIGELWKPGMVDKGPSEGSMAHFYAMNGAKSITFWVTTDTSAVIKQMQVRGFLSERKDEAATPTVQKKESTYREVSFQTTWKWSHFNEDFGEVKPPPTESVKSP